MTVERIGIAAGAGLVLAGTAFALAASWGGLSWVPGLVAGALVLALALVPRANPVAAAVAGIGIAAVAVVLARVEGWPVEPQPGLAIGLAALVATAVRRLDTPRAAGIAGAALAVLAVGPIVSAHAASGGAAVVAVADVLAWVAGAGIGLLQKHGRQRRREAIDAVRREERLALARELHDVVAHHVTGIVVQAQAARVVARRRPERLEESVAGIESAGSEALTAMRRVVGLLRDEGDAAPTSDGTESLEALTGRFDQQPVRLELDADPSAWPPELAGTVHRIVQEALTNVARHARSATAVTVQVRQRDGVVTVEVADNGTPEKAGYGLIGMRERVEALGGTLDAGFKVEARIPA
ncbi:sensor histidine kinase [Dactylosporangium salmoneum]|uniref:histidine kinase n=1 Tax=Dactylosporangium salmoneum TaxID=53361 RepID=A0ABN3GW53_9ACTN